MAHHNTVFSQILRLVPRHEFESLAKTHHQGRKLRKMTRWSSSSASAWRNSIIETISPMRMLQKKSQRVQKYFEHEKIRYPA